MGLLKERSGLRVVNVQLVENFGWVVVLVVAMGAMCIWFWGEILKLQRVVLNLRREVKDLKDLVTQIKKLSLNNSRGLEFLLDGKSKNDKV